MRAAQMACLFALFGCSAENQSTLSEGGGEAAGGSGGATTSGAGGNDGGGFSPSGSGGGSGGAPEIAEVYGHSPSVLYKLEPATKSVTVVGSFAGCGSVVDIAIDENNEIYGSSGGGLYRVDRLTAACTLVATGGYPNSLSFLPKGTLDPTVEALVGYNGSDYVRIDPMTGQTTQVGSLSGGYFSSGDIVSVKGGGTYLTVVGPSCGDCIVEINPQTGDLVNNLGPLGHNSVFGLAFWGGRAYGFSDGGALFEITLSPALSTSLIAIPDAPAGLQFWGAGSSTVVPLQIPE